jgi:hypothetical protein
MARIGPLLVFALLLLSPHWLWAQSKHCYRPAPPPACSGFITFELEYGRPLVQTNSLNAHQTSNGDVSFRVDDVDPYLMWRLGRMKNTGDGRAIGASVDAGFSGRGLRVGVEGTKRYWTTNRQALDLSLGVVQLGMAQHVSLGETDRRVALTGAVQYTTHDLIAAMLRADIAPGRRSTVALYGGGQLRSSGALVGTLVVGLGVALLIAAMSDPNY